MSGNFYLTTYKYLKEIKICFQNLKFYKNFALFSFQLSVLRFFIYICTLKYCERII